MVWKMEEKYEDYLRDESKLSGYADSISFPVNEEEIGRIIKGRETDGITIQGGRTGLVGGAVPMGGHLMNLSRMNRILSYKEDEKEAYITVEAGVTLLELEQEIQRHNRGTSMFWPCMPTEKSATLGGCIATNARGIYGAVYGEARDYTEAVRLITSSGKAIEFSREKDEKLLHQIIGSEGILGVITSIKLRLVPKPVCIWGMAFFFEKEEEAALFGDALFTLGDTGAIVAAAEWLDRRGITLLEEKKVFMSTVREFPSVLPQYQCAVFLELHGNEEEGVLETAGQIMELSMQYGANPDHTWAMSGERDSEKLRDYRHKVAEAVNMKVEENHRRCSQVVKLSADFSANGKFSEICSRYRHTLKLSGMDGTIFGHILSKDLHMNLFPESEEEYQRGRQQLLELGHEAAEGKLISEHGAGKLKAGLYSYEELQKRMEAKKLFDPGNLWNRGDVSGFELCSMYQTGAGSF